MSIEIVSGCLLDAFDKDEVNVIGHVVNCQGVMGSGIAKSIKDRYPEVFKTYKDFVNIITEVNQGNSSGLLGSTQLVICKDFNTKHYIANLFAQNYYGIDKRHLNYGALARTLIDTRRKIQDVFYTYKTPVIGFPYKMGSDRAGGDWDIVLEMIEFYFQDYEVKIYKLGD